jgi:MFS family permease
LRAHAKWFLCGLLLLATLLNYLDRQTMSVSASKIAEEMRLSATDLGRLFFAFYLSYGVAQLFVGGLLDRLTVVLAYALAVTAWSLAGAAAALATGFWSLFALRVLLGVCESPNWPLALRVVARAFPPGQRALANGVFQCGTSVGAVVAPPVVIWLTNQFNWRVAFVACGLAGLLWVALWLLWFHFQKEDAVAAEKRDRLFLEEAAGSPSTLGEMWRSRALWGMLVSTCFLNPLQYFYMSWLPSYFVKSAGVEFGGELARRLVLAYLAYDAGLLLAGALVAWLAGFWGSVRARLTVCAGGTLCMMGVPVVSQLNDLDVITAVICLATFGLGCCIVNYLAFTAEVSATKVSTAAGILGGAGSLAGAGFMLLVGDSIDRFGGFAFAFALAGAMPLVSLAGMWFSVGKRRGYSDQSAGV